MLSLRSPRLIQLWRFGQAGAVNAAFGFLTYALLVWMGLNIYVAQILATIFGIAFNYLTYSRHVFRDAEPARLRFVLSYIVNYLINLAMLAIAARLISSPYAAGLLAMMVAVIVNYFALKYFVFRSSPA